MNDWKPILDERIKALQDDMARNMNEALYGDSPLLSHLRRNAKPLTRWQRIKNTMERARDAWRVLTGELDPYDHY